MQPVSNLENGSVTDTHTYSLSEAGQGGETEIEVKVASVIGEGGFLGKALFQSLTETHPQISFKGLKWPGSNNPSSRPLGYL